MKINFALSRLKMVENDRCSSDANYLIVATRKSAVLMGSREASPCKNKKKRSVDAALPSVVRACFVV